MQEATMTALRVDHTAAPRATARGESSRRRERGHVMSSAASLASWRAREQDLAVLIKRLTHGDQRALEAVYEVTSSMVYGLALRILRDPDAAEEVTIEVYMQVYQKASHYDPDRGAPAAWLLTLTRSRAIDHQRREFLRQQRQTALEHATRGSLAPSPEACSVTIELCRVVRTALASLNPQQRQVIEIAYYEGLSHNEIAARLGQPLGTIKTRLRLGIQVLRKRLGTILMQ